MVMGLIEGRRFALALAVVSAVVGVVEVSPAVGANQPLKLIYKSEGGSAVPGEVGGSNVRCPAAVPHGISGFFEVASRAAYGQFAASISAPIAHGWTEGALNLSSSPQGFIAGAVCSSRAFVSRFYTITLSPNS